MTEITPKLPNDDELPGMLRCAKRELAMRGNVYEKRVSAGKMRRDDAVQEIQNMRRIVELLMLLNLPAGQAGLEVYRDKFIGSADFRPDDRHVDESEVLISRQFIRESLVPKLHAIAHAVSTEQNLVTPDEVIAQAVEYALANLAPDILHEPTHDPD